MAILTPMTLGDARRVGALYGLDVTDARGLLAGSVNSNYALTLAGGGRAFLRIYEEQTADAAAGEALLLAHLCAGGVPAPPPLRQQGERAEPAGGAFLAEHAGKPVAVFPWVDGDPLCQARVTPDVARRVGEALARVHVVGASFEGAPSSRFDLDGLDRRLHGARARPLDEDLARAVDALADRLDRLRAGTPRAPATTIHGDLFRDNVLWSGGTIAALLDFESASHGSAAFDLAVTVLAWCFGDDLDPSLAGALAAGYASVRPLSEAERADLFHQACVAAVRFSITRITDFELRPRGTSIYRDYRRFLARLRALDRLGPEGLAATLQLS